MSSTDEYKEPKAGWKNNAEIKTYKTEDVRKHNTKKDLWIIIHGYVYDVSEYARDHPGGIEPLTEVAGMDATTAYEDVGHSEDAEEIMQGYLVGLIEGAGSPGSSEAPSTSQANVPNVEIVRRSAARNDGENPSRSTASHATAIAATVVLSGVASAAWRSHFFHSSGDPTGAVSSSSVVRHGGFAQGALVSLSLCGVAGAWAIWYLQKNSKFGVDFSTFPAHVQSSSPGITNARQTALSPSQYRSYRLRQKEELSDGIFKFVLDLPTKYSILGLPIGQHVAIRATIDDHTVVRSYTPVSNNRDLGRLELLIRVYPNGKVGNYLKGLEVGEAVDIRGPKGAMRYRRNMCKAIGMVGGGTGITPLFQVIRAICEDDADRTQVTLIYGNRSELDILLRRKLDQYAETAGDKFKVVYTLDQPPPGWKGEVGHVGRELLQRHMPRPTRDNKVFLCGPPGMVNATKKTLTEIGFEDSGSVSKMGDQIFCF
ncbi:putative cytochrome-b5 reductase [Seiridium cardinale]